MSLCAVFSSRKDRTQPHIEYIVVNMLLLFLLLLLFLHTSTSAHEQAGGRVFIVGCPSQQL